MNYRTLVVGIVRANCYLVWNDTACVVIDPGDDFNRIEKALEEIGKPLKAILLTHGHFDHVGAVKELKERYQSVPVMLGAGDEELHLQADRLLQDGDIIEVDGMCFSVLATPGHTRGSVCYLYEDVVFSGDTLFRGTCGRCDFYGGDSQAMRKSLEKLAALEGDRPVYPGHEDETSLEQERKYNRFMERKE